MKPAVRRRSAACAARCAAGLRRCPDALVTSNSLVTQASRVPEQSPSDGWVAGSPRLPRSDQPTPAPSDTRAMARSSGPLVELPPGVEVVRGADGTRPAQISRHHRWALNGGGGGQAPGNMSPGRKTRFEPMRPFQLERCSRSPGCARRNDITWLSVQRRRAA